MVNNFLKPGLQDLCVSRTSFSWGIPVDFDPGHVVYVWLDALTNYITFCGYDPDGNHDEHYKKFWPADVHLIGKDIIRFHTIYWPIFLMALGEPLPKQVFGHPWLLVGDGKMSKSLGNVIYADDLVRLFGVDAVRYYVLHEMPFANDGVLSYELICERINSDLANVLGNLVNRTIAMTKKYFGGIVPAPTAPEALDDELKAVALGLPAAVEKKRWIPCTLQTPSTRCSHCCAAPTSISTRPCRGRSPRTRASRRVWARCCTTCSKRSALPLLN